MRYKILHLTLILMLALSALAQQGQRTVRVSDDAAVVERLRAHVSYLASDKLEGRRTGTVGADLAAAYISGEFARLGLKPPAPMAQAGQRAAHARKYEQSFPYVAGVELGKGNQLSFALAASSSFPTLRVGEDWMPLGFSQSVRVTNAPVVFVGYGITASELKYDDYTGANAAGRVALAFAGTPDGDNPHGDFARYADVRWKTIAARDHGAKALVVIAREDNFKDDRLARLSYDNSSGEAGLPVVAVSRQAAARLFGLTGPEQLAGIEDEVRKLSAQKLSSLKANAGGPSITRKVDAKTEFSQPRSVMLNLTTSVVRRNRPASNVIGILEGSDPILKREAIVIGAHYDHLGHGGEGSLAPREGEVHHGADDNASGVAGLIELARSFVTTTQRPKRTLVFIAFSGEEEGLLGSNFYVNHPAWPLAQTVAMINMDMIGRMKEKKLIIGGVGTAREWRELIEGSNIEPLNLKAVRLRGPYDKQDIITDGPLKGMSQEDAKRSIMPLTEMFKLTLNEDGYGPSDHSSFYARQIPVLFFWTGTHEDYHKPSDTADKLNYEDEARVVWLVGHIINALNEKAARPTYTVAKSESAGRSTGFRVYLGTIPNYAETGEGLKLDGVRDDSPAAAAGLRAGDVVVKLAGREIKNVYDYTYALGEMKAGQEYEVEVMRGTERLSLKITPAPRR